MTKQVKQIDKLLSIYAQLPAGFPREHFLLLLFDCALTGQLKQTMTDLMHLEVQDEVTWRKTYQNFYFDEKNGKAFRKRLKAACGYILAPAHIWPSQPQKILGQLERLAASHPIFRQIIAPFAADFAAQPLQQLAWQLQGLRLDFATLAHPRLTALYRDVAGGQGLSQTLQPLMAEILASKNKGKALALYDATLQSADFLALPWAQEQAQPVDVYAHGQDTKRLSFALMALMIAGAKPQQLHLYQGQYLDGDWPMSQTLYFDMIFLMLTQTQSWSADKAYLTQPAFEKLGVLPPKSKSDWAQVLLAYHRLKQGGRMLAIVPEAALSRSHAEADVRHFLAKQQAFDAIIQLPTPLASPQQPLVLLVLKKGGGSQPTFYLNGSALCCDKEANEVAQRLAKAYTQRKTVQGISRLVASKTMIERADNLLVAKFVQPSRQVQPVASPAHSLHDVAQIATQVPQGPSVSASLGRQSEAVTRAQAMSSSPVASLSSSQALDATSMRTPSPASLSVSSEVGQTSQTAVEQMTAQPLPVAKKTQLSSIQATLQAESQALAELLSDLKNGNY